MQQRASRTGIDARRYAPAAERDPGPILDVLGRHLPPAGTILEIGSATGQHVIAFAAAHPEVCWHPGDPDPPGARQHRRLGRGSPPRRGAATLAGLFRWASKLPLRVSPFHPPRLARAFDFGAA